jgi:hypothetical protein
MSTQEWKTLSVGFALGLLTSTILFYGKRPSHTVGLLVMAIVFFASTKRGDDQRIMPDAESQLHLK